MSNPIPMFSAITHPVFAHAWFLASLDQIFTGTGGRIEKLGINLEAIREFGCSDVSLHGTPWHHPNESREEGVTQEELDQIPAARLLDRRAKEIWDWVPLSPHFEGGLSGDMEFVCRPGQLYFCVEPYDPEQAYRIEMEASWSGKCWENRTSISVAYNGPMTDVVEGDWQAILGQCFTTKQLRIPTMPTVIGHKMLDCGSLRFDVTLDAFAGFKPAD